jgi:hypothetical protein
MKKVKNGDYDSAFGMLSKSMGGGAPKAGTAEKMQLKPAHLQPHQPNTQGELVKLMAGLPSRTAQEAFERKKANRKRAQDRYNLDSWKQS